MRFLLRNLTSWSINKLMSLKFQVQLPIYNVRAIMHRLHDLTGNDDKSLKGESLVCFNFRTINTMKQLTLYCDLLLPGSPSLFSFVLFNCFFFFFLECVVLQLRQMSTPWFTLAHPYYRLPPLLDLKPSHSFIRIWLILYFLMGSWLSHIYESKSNKT